MQTADLHAHRRMDRRSFLTALGLGVAGATRPHDRTRVQPYHVSIDVPLLGPMLARRADRQWCWAACLEGLFTYYGHPVTQERIVRTMWGGPTAQPGSPRQILAAATRAWTDNDGEPFRARAITLPVDDLTAIREMERGHPMIVEADGLPAVLTGVDFERYFYGGGMRLEAIYMRDPVPASRGVEQVIDGLTWRAGVSAAARINVLG